MMTPLEIILNALPQINNAEVSVRNFEKLGLSLSAQPIEAVAPLAAGETGWRSVELADVTHIDRREGEEESFLLGLAGLMLCPGELILPVDGSGKTTLAKIVLGLSALESGDVRLDGVRLTARRSLSHG